MNFQEFCEQQPEAGELLMCPDEQQNEAGYFYTLHEILQQPTTWVETCERLVAQAPALADALGDINALVLTGSGSSQFAGECVRPVLQQDLQIPVDSIDGGTLLTHGSRAIVPNRPLLLVSLARSGNSPESAGAVSLLLETEPEIRHLVVTCNAEGSLAKANLGDQRVAVLVLDERTNDQSLVMTSSFTNMVLAARFLGLIASPGDYRATCVRLSALCERLFELHFGSIARAARSGFRRALFLGSGARFGAACEASLKMLEMTDGRVATEAETYLGLRHGPMSFVHEDTLIVGFLSCDPLLRAYESDVIRELNRKRLGCGKLLLGDGVDRALLEPPDFAIELRGMAELGDDNVTVLDVVTGQLLAFFRCRDEGLKPDTPSADGIIHRVVESFPVHRRSDRANP